MLYTKDIDPSVKIFRSLIRLYRSIGLRFFFLMTTIDLIDVFCRQSIIGIDTIDVFLTIGAQLCSQRCLPALLLHVGLNSAFSVLFPVSPRRFFPLFAPAACLFSRPISALLCVLMYMFHEYVNLHVRVHVNVYVLVHVNVHVGVHVRVHVHPHAQELVNT
jgi:hypothetical protein